MPQDHCCWKVEARSEPVNIDDRKGKTLLQVREECQNEVGRKQNAWEYLRDVELGTDTAGFSLA